MQGIIALYSQFPMILAPAFLITTYVRGLKLVLPANISFHVPIAPFDLSLIKCGSRELKRPGHRHGQARGVLRGRQAPTSLATPRPAMFSLGTVIDRGGRNWRGLRASPCQLASPLAGRYRLDRLRGYSFDVPVAPLALCEAATVNVGPCRKARGCLQLLYLAGPQYIPPSYCLQECPVPGPCCLSHSAVSELGHLKAFRGD